MILTKVFEDRNLQSLLTNCAQKTHLKSKEKKDEMPRVERATKEQQRERDEETARWSKRERDGEESEKGQSEDDEWES